MDIDDALRRKAIKILDDEQNALEGAFDSPTAEKSPKGILFDKIEQNKDGTWSNNKYEPKERFYDNTIVGEKERQIEDDAAVLRELCLAVDNKIIRINNEINDLKSQIVTLSTEATARNCNPGIAQSTTGTPGQVGYTTSLITNTTLNNDVEFVKTYDKMAGPGFDPGAVNPFDPDKTVQLNSSYAGYGYKNVRDNVEFRNTSNVATGSSVCGSGSLIGTGRFDLTTPAATHAAGIPLVGYTYNGAGAAPATDTSLTGAAAQNRCVEIRTEINNLYDQIIEKRIARDSLRGALNDVKDTKSEKELADWGIKNTKNEVNVRKNKHKTAIGAIKKLDVPQDQLPDPEGLFLELDAANNSSYFGSGTIWYDLTDNNDADLQNNPTFVESTVTDLQNHFLLDGVDDHVDFEVANVTNTTSTVTVEILAQMTVNLNTADADGYMLFGWDGYSVWTGPVPGNGTQIRLGFNTGNGDLYGLSSTRVESMDINKNGPTEAEDVLPGQWSHLVFEMRSDVSYTNNKIYVDGVLQTSLEDLIPGNAEDSSERNFNNGLGRIAGWRKNTMYRMPVEVSLFRVYNKALTQEEITSLYNAVNGRFTS